MAIISLKGLDKAAVLAALYNASKPQGLGFLHYNPEPMTIEVARKILSVETNFDYLCGRVIKVDLSGDTLDTWGFDRDNGESAAEKALKSLQETSDPNNEYIRTVHEVNTSMSVLETMVRLG